MKLRAIAAAVSVTAVAALAASCGNPAGPGAQKTFVYTPVPYTVVPTGPDSTILIAIDPDKDPGEDGVRNHYVANTVVVEVEGDRLDDFEGDVREYGLRFHLITPSRDAQTRVPEYFKTAIHSRGGLYRVIVPPGAALAAIDLISDMSGVMAVNLEYIGPLNR